MQLINYEESRHRFKYACPVHDVPELGLRFRALEPTRPNILKAITLHEWDEWLLCRDCFHIDDLEEPLPRKGKHKGQRDRWRKAQPGDVLIGHTGKPSQYVSVFRLSGGPLSQCGFTFGGYEDYYRFVASTRRQTLSNISFEADNLNAMIVYLSKTLSQIDGYAYELAHARISGPSYANSPFDLAAPRKQGSHRGGLGTRLPLSLTRVEALDQGIT